MTNSKTIGKRTPSNSNQRVLSKPDSTTLYDSWKTREIYKDGPWYSRGYLPHFVSGEVQSVTIRLFDSLPKSRVQELKESLLLLPATQRKIEYRKKVEKWIDQGYGACYLNDHSVASIVKSAILHYNGTKYSMHAWVIMPNHVHLLLSVNRQYSLPTIIKNFKSYTARETNNLLGRTGSFWFRDYYDRYIRNEKHYTTVINYIEYNPVHAGLCQAPEHWAFSSATAKRS